MDMYEVRQNKERISRVISRQDKIQKNNKKKGTNNYVTIVAQYKRTYTIIVRGMAPNSNKALTSREIDLYVIANIGGQIKIQSIEAIQNGAYYITFTTENMSIRDIRQHLQNVPQSISCEVSVGSGPFPRT